MVFHVFEEIGCKQGHTKEMRTSRAPGTCALTLRVVLAHAYNTVQVVICVKLNLVSLFFMFFEEIGF